MNGFGGPGTEGRKFREGEAGGVDFRIGNIFVERAISNW